MRTPDPDRLPFSAATILTLAGLLVPLRLRAAWRREWDGELWHVRAQMRRRGMTEKETGLVLLELAWGAAPDAAVLFRRQVESWLHGNLAWRAALAMAIVALCLVERPATRSLIGDDASSAVIFSRTAGVLGLHSSILPRELESWREHRAELPGIAWFAVVAQGAGRPPALLVTPNFLDVLGTPERLAQFRFAGQRFRHYIVQPADSMDFQKALQAGAIGRRSDFPDPRAAQRILGRFSTPLPVRIDSTPIGSAARHAWLLSGVAFLVCMAAGVIVLSAEKLRRPANAVTFGFLGSRILNLAIPAGLWLLFSRVLLSLLTMESTGYYDTPSELAAYALLPGVYLFLYARWTASGRRCCRVCGRKASQPVNIGTWGNVWLDAPQTEYLCPLGHGRLVQAQAASTSQWAWSRLDESWAEAGL